MSMLNLTSPAEIRQCVYCSAEYQGRIPRQKYCSRQCSTAMARAVYRANKPPAPAKRPCAICKTEFQPRRHSQRYCSPACGTVPLGQRKPILSKTCPTCGTEFTSNHSTRTYCKPECRASSNARRQWTKPKETPEPIPSCYRNFGELEFRNEAEFHAWFDLNFALFGIKRLVKTDRFFPDIRAEMHDGRFLDIELEYHVNNFLVHKHDFTGCDLVISFLKFPHQTMVASLPVIAIFDIRDYRGCNDYDRETRTLTPYFQSLADYCVSALRRAAPRLFG